MKKFYTTMAAITASLAVSVSAATIARLPQNGSMELTKHTEAVAIAPNSLPAINKGEATMTIKPLNKGMNKKVGALTMDELYGDYEWTFYDLQEPDADGNPSISSYEVTFVSTDALGDNETYEPNEFVIAGFGGYVLLASYDTRSGAISIGPNFVDYNDTYQEYLVFSNCKLDPTATAPTTKDIMPDFENPLVFNLDNLSDGTQSWMTTGYYGIAGFITDDGGQTGVSTYEDGYYMLCQIGLVTDSPWVDLGEAEWTDGVFPPMFAETPKQVTSTVKIYSNTQTTVPAYRIMTPATSIGIKGGKMDLYVTHPDLCEVPLQSASFTTGNDGLTFIGSFAYLRNVSDDPNITLEEYVAAYLQQYPNQVITAKEEDGIMTIRFSPNSIGFVWPYAPETSTTDPGAIYGTSEARALESTLKFSTKQDGIEDIIATPGVNAPVEYFNLQGIRVNEPAKGQLVIKRQGNKTSKVVM